MLKKLICLFLGTMCGMALSVMVSIPEPFSMETLFVNFVLSPVTFFASMLVFMVGFVCFSILIKGAIEQTYQLNKGRKAQLNDLFICYSVLISFCLLFFISFWQTFFLFLFSIVYGLFSIELSNKTNYEVNR
jgi:hypothetical protein